MSGVCQQLHQILSRGRQTDRDINKGTAVMLTFNFKSLSTLSSRKQHFRTCIKAYWCQERNDGIPQGDSHAQPEAALKRPSISSPAESKETNATPVNPKLLRDSTCKLPWRKYLIKSYQILASPITPLMLKPTSLLEPGSPSLAPQCDSGLKVAGRYQNCLFS